MPRSRQTRRAQKAPLEPGDYESALVERIRTHGLSDLLRTVANDHFIPLAQIVGRSRRPTPTRARHEVWRRLRDEHEFSFNEIAALFDRDHTSIMSGIARARARIEKANGQGDTT